MPITEIQLKNLKPRSKPYRVREKGVDRGFGVQVSSGGRKSFFLAYQFDGKDRFMKLGVYPECPINEARERCRVERKLVDQGRDPQEEKKHKEEAEKICKREESLRGSVEQLFQHYINYLDVEKSPGSARQVRQAYQKDVLPVVDADMKAKDVTPRGALIQANRTRSYLMAAFKHGIEHDHNPMNLDADVLFSIQHNPVRDIPRIVKRERVGDRDLGTNEIATFWHSLDEYQGMDLLTKLVFKLALATGGQRIKEVSQAQWSEFATDRRLWEIPPDRTKNQRHHIVPLCNLAVKLLSELKEITGSQDFLFPMKGVKDNESKPRPLPSLSRALSRYCERTEFEKFTPRDIRRTCKTRMGELGLSKEIRDRLHNHALNDVSSKHYDRYDYLPEKSEAMAAWGNYLKQIISGADVIPIRKVGK